MNIGILIADDHTLFRVGLRTLLEKESRIEVLGEAEDGRSAVLSTKKLKPDVVIMDVAMPGLNGVEATRQLLGLDKPPKVLALSIHSDTRFVTRMLQAGASGYLLKDAAFEELAEGIRTVARGQLFLSKALTGPLVKDYVRKLSTDAIGRPRLTPREREVLQLVSEGKPTRIIAEMLGVSVKTIETHRKQIMTKLDLHSVAELTKYAVREGLTGLDD